MIGAFTFLVFAIASLAQLVVGALLDRLGPRKVFIAVAAIQTGFFALMPGQWNWSALAIALGFMAGAFGQVPINDYMVGKMASGEFRARVFGARYVVSFMSLALSLPLIGMVHQRWGFDTLFMLLAVFLAAGATVALAANYHVLGTDKVGQDVLYQTLKSVRTALVTNTRVDVEERQVPGFVSGSTTVADLVQSLVSLKTNTRDIISILRAVKAAGALHAELIVQ